ncbi:uncharacterized protein [Nicotiana sylvestris]|uniref:uncharacterized protein n=1 Tax=Nicotiana sylvestris TaxID=4096 RepID=UPI00388CCFF0
MNRKHNFCVVALMEPFQKKRFTDRYRRRLNMEMTYANINGQIWLFFNAVVEWELVEDTEQYVTVRVHHHDMGQHMMMIFVYAKCSVIERLELWDNLYYLASYMKLSCLFEQGYKGSPFIWWNGRSNAACIFKILDRIFVNLPFQNILPTIEVEHLIRIGSDHAPLLITYREQTTNSVKLFRFLNFWTKYATFMDVVRRNWEVDFIGDPFLMFKQKLKRVKAALSKWSRETFGDIFKQLAIFEDIVRVKEMLFEEEPTIENMIVLQKAQSELKKYLSIEEQYWKQKAGMTWFAEGDMNISFFHNHVNGKRKKLQLKRIKSESGVWIEDQEQLATAAVDFYQEQLPTIEEVRTAVFELSGESASGPDGFIGLFYQTCWDVIGADIHNMGRSIFENILLTQEIVVDIRLRRKPANMVIKLDMAKAYDKSSGFFKSSRGVKQGDPLSPALFILSAEWSDPLNHLTYADDIIIFASAHPPSLSKIMAVLGNYEKIPGQMINKDKSSYYMYSKILNGLCQSVGAITGFAKGKLLSFGGKATLITSVLQSMSVHMLSVLHLPKNVLEHLHKIFARFFWSTKEEGRSRHWASWKNLFLPKEEGGLGFKSLHDVSRALFAKLWWRFRTTKSLWSNFMWNKYCKKEIPTMV